MINKQDRLYLEKRKRELIDSCPICKGRRAYCSCSYAFQFEFKKIKAAIPEQYRLFTIDDLVHPQLTKQKKELIEYTKLFSEDIAVPNLIISGTKGLAKSSVAAWILMEAMKHKKTGYYFSTVTSVRDAITKAWDKDTKNDEDCVAASSADVIVVDGLGLGVDVPANVANALAETLRSRAIFNKTTIFVSSVDSDHLTGYEYDIVHTSPIRDIKFSGFDYVKSVVNKAKAKKKAAKGAKK